MKKFNKGKNLPDSDHVIRRVSSSKLRRDGDGNILGFLPQAFALRLGEKSLSVNWLEIYESDHNANITKTVWELRAANDISKKSAFGIGNVGNIKNVCKDNGALVKIVYAPRDNIPSHSDIRHLPQDDLSLLQDLATNAFCELVRNSDIEEKQ